ncbi:MAG: hypothetical protein M3457_21780 [Chloroflexota bacterium]|nr:hypothetical protein [Chloroflexota bacterium]
MSAWVIYDQGGFDLRSTIEVNGQLTQLPNTLATVDHPFHATRADTLLKSLREWQPLRWVAHHQGGYPVEFYPLGFAWLDVGLWAALAGQFPVIAVHKLSVMLLFVLPGVGFWILSRGDKLNPFVPVLALAIHISVPGDWMHGGRMELLYWGLATNVGGATLAFIMMAALSRYVMEGSRWYCLLAVLAASAAIYTNPRSAIAIAVAATAVLLSSVFSGTTSRRANLGTALSRIGLVGVLGMLLTAPLLLPLVRYERLYYFVNFEAYSSLRDYLTDSSTAITPIVCVIALAGVLIAIAVKSMRHTRSAAFGLALFVAATVAFATFDRLGDLIQQLEAPRLMPFQRFLAIYVAAAAVAWVIERLVSMAKVRGKSVLSGGVLGLAAFFTILTFGGAFGELDVKYQQPVLWTTGIPEFAHYTSAIDEAAELAPEGTAIYVVGDQQSWWHEHLWGPTRTDAPFFYEDFMWYWHEDHEGPYDNQIGHAYHDPEETFNPEWLHAHGVSVLVVTNMPVPVGATDPKVAARTNPNFTYQGSSGLWDIYSVNDPVPIVTNGETEPQSLAIENERIIATFDSASGEVLIRRNWFPRWEAFADGQRVDIQRTDNGYMRLDVPEGTREIELVYAVTGLDWLGRLAAIGGLVLTGAVAFGAGTKRYAWIDERTRITSHEARQDP